MNGISKTILMIEAFYGGSHKQLIDLIFQEFSDSADLYTMPAKKWHWRSIASPLHLSEVIPVDHNYKVLFSSSVLPLADLIAIRPDLSKLFKVVYFHENQLVYPVQEWKNRYFQHGYNEVLTCLAADQILFNSHYNQESFLASLNSYFSKMPDYKPKNLSEKIRPKCSVLYFPLLPQKLKCTQQSDLHCDHGKSSDEPLHIVWPHRWEHDKNPESFFEVMFRLKDSEIPFKLSVLGEQFSENPVIFEEAAKHLKDNIIHWGYKETKEEYYSVLRSADVVVSTANHEFFGVSMLEATMCGSYPLCPKRLIYPELYPETYLYTTSNKLFKKLKYFCKRPSLVRNHKLEMDFSKFYWDHLREGYRNVLHNYKDIKAFR